MSFELPTGSDRKQIGENVYNAVQTAFDTDSLLPRAVSKGIHRYLSGDRNFRVSHPLRPQRSLFECRLEDGMLPHDAVVSDITTEIGKQQRIDFSPITVLENHTVESARNKAVSWGILSHLFTSRVTSRPFSLFQRSRVTDGCAGLFVSPTVYPGFGWGLKITNIPLRELVFLPVGCRADSVRAIAWRKWVTLNDAKKFVEDTKKVAGTAGGRFHPFPVKGSDDYESLMLRDVPFGHTIVGDDDETASGGLTFETQRRDLGESKSGKGKNTSKFVLLTQIFVSDDMMNLDRRILCAGSFVIHDSGRFAEFERPQMPIATSVYAEAGGPYSRSYAQARVAVNARDELILYKLISNFCDTDAYGIIALSQSMGLNLENIFEQGDGFKVAHYQPDPQAPNHQPIQLSPINMGNVVGRAFGVITALSNTVFPSSPIYSGDSVGRVDSDAAYARLDQLGQTALRAGSESARAAVVQIYRAGLEIAGNHYEKGEKIPIFFLSPDLAGVIIDAEELPQSLADTEKKNLRRRLTAETALDSGDDPLYAAASSGNGESLLSLPGDRAPELVPVPRFTIGPNVIPSPNEVTIDIRSMLPRDPNAEFGEIMSAIQVGASSVMEGQIEMMERGVKRYFGGRMVRATYKTAVLNLLSAFGNGVEAGPILLQPHIFSRAVGYWIVSAFIAEPLFGLASKVVRSQVMKLLAMYAPVNMTGKQLSADEAAAMYAMQERQRMMAQRGGQLQSPELPPGF